MTKKRYAKKTDEQFLQAFITDVFDTRARDAMLSLLKRQMGPIEYIHADFHVQGKTLGQLTVAEISDADVDDYRFEVFLSAYGHGVGVLEEISGSKQFIAGRAFDDLTLYIAPDQNTRLKVVLPSLKAVFLAQLLTLLRSVGVEKLAICECQQPFVRVGRRENCSPRCQKRYYMRRFREGGDR